MLEFDLKDDTFYICYNGRRVTQLTYSSIDDLLCFWENIATLPRFANFLFQFDGTKLREEILRIFSQCEILFSLEGQVCDFHANQRNIVYAGKNEKQCKCGENMQKFISL